MLINLSASLSNVTLLLLEDGVLVALFCSFGCHSSSFLRLNQTHFLSLQTLLSGISSLSTWACQRKCYQPTRHQNHFQSHQVLFRDLDVSLLRHRILRCFLLFNRQSLTLDQNLIILNHLLHFLQSGLHSRSDNGSTNVAPKNFAKLYTRIVLQ